MSSFGSFWILISVTRSKISFLIFSQYLLRIPVQKLSTSNSTALSVLITPFAAKSCPAESKAEKNTPVFEPRLMCFASSVFILVFTWSFFKVKVAFLAKGTGVSFDYLLGILYENGCRLQEKACFLRRVSYTAWSDAPVVQWIGHSPAKTAIPVRLRAGALWNIEYLLYLRQAWDFFEKQERQSKNRSPFFISSLFLIFFLFLFFYFRVIVFCWIPPSSNRSKHCPPKN